MPNKCIDCGFLAVRNENNHHLEEARRDASGLIKEIQYEFHQGKNIQPLCFVNRVNLPFAYTEVQMSTQYLIDNETKINIVLKKERDCDLFREYQQGFTPKEHREMMDRERFQEWQDKQRKEDKRWRVIELVVISVVAILAATIGWFLRGLQ